MATKPAPFICSRCMKSVTRRNARSMNTVAYTPPHTTPLNPAHLTLSPENLNSYKDTSPPNPQQTNYASQYFTQQSPQFLFSTAHFRGFPPSSAPEVTFLGRSNVGKSSLLNALFNRPNSKLAFVSKRPGRTRVMNVFGIGGASEGGVRRIVKPGMSLEMMRDAYDDVEKGSDARNFIGNGGLAVVDCPGYGYASRDEWGKEVVKYLQGRKQLRRAFLLIDAEHGLKTSDQDILEILREAGTPHQIVLSKADKIVYPRAKKPSSEKIHNHLLQLRDRCQEIRHKVQPNGARDSIVLGDILCCSSEKSIEKGKKLGLDELRWAVLQAAGLESMVDGRKRSIDANLLERTEGEDGIYAWDS